mgnify:CR=1 FL=1|jgi:hypothetical protein|tara:strand:+ start:1593 stop:1790 length:198 start_codon:yes stop_codon:yes gene_type:complete
MKKQYIILEPGLTYLRKGQIITEAQLNEAKIDFGHDSRYKSTDEKHNCFTYKELSEKVVIANGKL